LTHDDRTIVNFATNKTHKSDVALLPRGESATNKLGHESRDRMPMLGYPSGSTSSRGSKRKKKSEA